MSKPIKTKKDKVRKITEEEYAEYISSLKSQSEQERPPEKQDSEQG